MDAGTLNIREIFGQDRRHVVPLFQRPYVWRRDTHWEPFWEDIRAVADRLLAGQAARPHFLGAIVVDQQFRPMGHLETRLLIDGQQRLTTIQLFIQAFADLCVTPATESHHKALLKLTRNDDPLSRDPDDQFKVWPTNEDREHFRRVMSSGSRESVYREASNASSILGSSSHGPVVDDPAGTDVGDQTQKPGDPKRAGFAHLFKSGERVRVIKGRYAGRFGTIHSQRSATGLWVVIDEGGERPWSLADRRLQKLDSEVSPGSEEPPGSAQHPGNPSRRQPDIPQAGHPIADAYLYFSTAIADWLALTQPGAETRVATLYTTLRDYLRMVVIDLGPEDDAQVIFETLNARGAPLLPSDLVKNLLFHRAQLQGEEIDPLYRQHWRPFDEEAPYWRQELGRGHARRARIDTFLQHYLTLRKGDDVPVGHLYTSFRNWVDASKETASSNLRDLRRYAVIYQRFDHMPAESPEALFFERLSLMETTTAYPLLLGLFARHGDHDRMIRAILRDLESFLVRRTICQLNTRGYNRLFVELLGALSGDDGAPDERVRRFLLSSDAESSRWPKDSELREACLDAPLYRGLVRQRVRMLLEGLERQLHTGKVEKIQFGEKLTIEHLMPQEWRKNWPLPSTVTPEEAEARRERALHTLGNLTLLTRKLNPAISNGPWERKREDILVHSALNLNRTLPPIWDESAIRRRGEALFDLTTRIWSRPGE